MLIHYIKVAIRNLWKYKTQSVISIIGLAVGFVCFSLSALWIRYERTFDTFHKNAENIHLLTRPANLTNNKVSTDIPGPFPTYLKETFPEIKEAINFSSYNGRIASEQGFLEMFDIKILEGSIDFENNSCNGIAITKKLAEELFGNESPVGKINKEKTGYGLTITAVISGYFDHSNYPLEIFIPLKANKEWNVTSNDGLIQLQPNTDIEAFKKKLNEHVITQVCDSEGNTTSWTNTSFIPLTELRYTDPKNQRNIKYSHIQLFALAGLLVILSSLFNYFTLFISRFRIREKEIALRIVCGSSTTDLFMMLSVEFLLALFSAFILGLIFTKIILTPFLTLSGIKMDGFGIFGEHSLYVISIIIVAQIVFFITLGLLRRHSLASSMKKNKSNVFRKISLVLQLTISILFIFSTIVIVKQVSYLHDTANAGFDAKKRGSVRLTALENTEGFIDKIKQMPEITETLYGYAPIVPVEGRSSSGVSYWQDKTDEMNDFSMEHKHISPEYFDFYNLQLIEGEKLEEGDSEKLQLINEAAKKRFGWDEAAGKTFRTNTVKGVIKNIYNFIPTLESNPTCYFIYEDNNKYLLFKYQEEWNIVENKIKELYYEEFSETIDIKNTEEEYNKFFQSEEALIKILNIIALVCFFISIFGFVSLVSLNMSEQRKQIAVRKINGATLKNILSMYFHTYVSILIVGSVIAFPLGYILMKRWLEQYSNQTNISAWIYLVIFTGIALAIILSIGWRIYKASRENPAETLKSN